MQNAVSGADRRGGPGRERLHHLQRVRLADDQVTIIHSINPIVFIVTLGKYMTVKLRMKSEKHSGEIDKHYVLVWHDKVEVSKDP